MRFSARKGMDFSLARRRNVTADMDGTVRLSSTNEMSSPRLDRYTPAGEPVNLRLTAPDAPVARNVYLAGKSQRATRQNSAPLPRSRSTYLQPGPTVIGPTLPVSGTRKDAPRPAQPTARARLLSVAGYPAGAYGTSYCWVIGDPNKSYRRRLTTPAKFTWFSLEQGQSYKQPLPKEIPAGITAVALLLTEPDGNEASATIQRVIDIRDFVPREYPMEGPYRKGQSPPAENETFVGPPTLVGQVYRQNRSCTARVEPWRSWFTLTAFSTRLLWQFRTRYGWSAVQPGMRVYTRKKKGAALFIRPGKCPPEAIAWRPLFESTENRWMLPGLWWMKASWDAGVDLDRAIPLITNDPEKYQLEETPIEASYTDETGIEGPEEELEAPLAYGDARISPDTYTVYVTDVYPDGRESVPSAGYGVIVNTGQILEVSLTETSFAGNILPNALLNERDNANRPTSWTFTTGTNLSVRSPSRGVVDVRDSTGVAGQAAITDPAPVPGVLCVRADISLSRHTSGNLALFVRFFSSTGAVLSREVVAVCYGVGEAAGEVSFGSLADRAIPAGAVTYGLELYRNGTPDLDGRAVNVGVFIGLAAPSKYGVPPGPDGTADDVMPVAATERPATMYPSAGYAVMVDDPAWATAGATPTGDGAEYYAPWGTPVSQNRFASHIQEPLQRRESYVFSAYLERKGGGNQEVALLCPSVKRADGTTVERLPAVYSGTADTEGRHEVSFVSPDEPCYLDVTHSEAGQGRIRLWGWQLQRGFTASPWTDAVAPDGEIAVTFDTSLPGAPVLSVLGMLGKLVRYTEGGALEDTPGNSSVGVRYRTRQSTSEAWSGYFDDITLMPRRRLIEIEATLTADTTDTSVTPQISELYAEAQRAESSLCKSDGSEYFGGVRVASFSAPQYGDNAERTKSAAGSEGFRELYRAPRKIYDLKLECWYDSTAEEVSYDSSHGDRLFRLDTPEAVYAVRLLNVKFAPDRDTWITIEGRRIYLQTATVEEADLLGESSLVEEA